jgi:hypothetical protein
VHERALSTPQQVNVQDVHVCGMKLAAFFAIFAQSWLTFINRGKNFNPGYLILKFFQIDITGMFRMTSSARYFKEGVGSSRPT